MPIFAFNRSSGLVVDAPAEKIAHVLSIWGSQDVVSRPYAQRLIKGPVSAALALLQPLTFTPSKAILASLKRGGTVFFDNHRDGFMPQAEAFVLCERMRCRTVFLAAEERPEDSNFGSNQFYVGQNVANEVVQRQVMLIKESGWQFTEAGMPLPFEQLDTYKKVKKRERLTVGVLKEYALTMGYRLANAEDYCDDPILISW